MELASRVSVHVAVKAGDAKAGILALAVIGGIELLLRQGRQQQSQAVLDAWTAMHARGLPWKERYTKNARLDIDGGDAARRPSGMGMDVLLDAPGKLQAGDALAFQVLRDGAPLAGFAVELRHAADVAGGIWLRTDGLKCPQVPPGN